MLNQGYARRSYFVNLTTDCNNHWAQLPVGEFSHYAVSEMILQPFHLELLQMPVTG